MRRIDPRRGVAVSAVLFAAMLAVVGHVCVGPLLAHAVPVDGHGSHDGDAADHGAHTASCEAVRGEPPVAPAAPATAMTCLPVVAPPSACRRDRPSIIARAGSPPLFLLHTALLI
jgi:hypothetical protein